MTSELHSNLKDQVSYIEQQANVIVVTAAMYARRHIFEGDDGKFYVMTEHAGYDTFPDMMTTITAIGKAPNKYPLAPKHRV